MKNTSFLLCLSCLVVLTAFQCSKDLGRKIGVTLVAPREMSAQNPLAAAKEMGFGWTAIVPYGFIPRDSVCIRYGEVTQRMMWGERPEGIRQSVRWARELGMKTMLKPQVWAGRQWIGAVKFDNEADWQKFEESYTRYLLIMAEIAQQEGVELLCIGTELSNESMQRPGYWSGLIRNIRKVYKGALTYSANWDNWEKTPFWQELDYIGLGSYFPLSDAVQPDPEALRAAWQPIAARMEAMSKALNKPVLFTEMGYLGVPGCCGKLWELEPKRDSLPVDTACQARAFEALLSVFTEKDWWHGGFVWKYYPHAQPRYGAKDYDIQGKPAGAVFRRWNEKL
jgi:hypothetical protein